MTRSGGGRSQRTASRLAYASTTGEGSLGLPAIQGVAERATVRADRAALRLGLRTLVVAGFAGAAWLLCANAAQAADAPATDRTTDLSAVGLRTAIGNGGAGEDPALDRAASAAFGSPVTDAATTAHQPVLGVASVLLTGAQAPGGAATSVVLPGATATHATPIADPAHPAGATGAAPGRADGNGADGDLLSGAVGGLTVPPGIAGRPGGSPTSALTQLARAIAPVTASLDGLVRPAAGELHTAVFPVTSPARGGTGLAALHPLTALLDPVGGRETGVSSRPVLDERRTPPAGKGRAAQVVTAAPVNGDRAATVTMVRFTSVTRTDTRSATRPRAGAEAVPAGMPAVRTGTSDVPTRPAPPPLRGWAGSGPSTVGSSAPPEGGAYAVAPVSVAGQAAATRRLLVPADVEVLRLDAETPTVSPD
jgi:hypothetical protein